MRKTPFKQAISGLESRRILCSTLASPWSRRISATRINRTTICAVTVATAAPITSNLGNGPTPRTRSGSRIIFSIRPKKFAFSGVLESPWAVKRPVSTWERKENRISPQVILI